jgi:hypothetical protein
MSNLIITAGLCILSGLIIYFSLILIKQNWVNTVHYLITYLLLPPIAFVITNVISNNLALSLGMIGALSIVRFRNPVKNPLELVIFFALITLGIAYGVNFKWGIALLLIVEAVLFFSKFLEIFFKKFNFSGLFKYSFSTNDGELKNLLEVEADAPIDYLENHKSLIYFSLNNNTYFYKISLKEKKLIDEIKKKLLSEKNVKNIDVRYGSN